MRAHTRSVSLSDRKVVEGQAFTLPLLGLYTRCLARYRGQGQTGGCMGHTKAVGFSVYYLDGMVGLAVYVGKKGAKLNGEEGKV